MVVTIIIVSMLGCMLQEISSEAGDGEFSPTFKVFMVKLPCATALHFVLFPEISKGMNLMKFANNESKQFIKKGANYAYLLGLI